jgi:MerR family transcriptional regulator/heat shock protein HspR
MKNKVMQHEPLLTIGTVSDVLGVAVQTIRLYEREGLVIPYKTQTGRRMYSTNDLERVNYHRQSRWLLKDISHL